MHLGASNSVISIPDQPTIASNHNILPQLQSQSLPTPIIPIMVSNPGPLLI